MAATLALRPTAPRSAETAQHRLERLYRSSRDDVYAYVASVLRDQSLAEDVTAAAFERAFRRRRLFDPRRGSERAWLFGIARNAALDELRRRKRHVATVEHQAAQIGEELPQAEAVLGRATLRAALAGLPPRERELIALKFYAGLSNQEIARVLHVSESNAGTLLHRAITKLRKACDEEA
jgi:RNA polymerase sigma-70 factor (ECF subfamily)